MSDTKVLQSILDGQKDIKDDIKKLEKETKKGFNGVNKRIDKLGKNLAYLEDDAPTREEHDELDGKVTVLEKKVLQA